MTQDVKKPFLFRNALYIFIIVIGVVLGIVGLIMCVTTGGLPYQNPPPEQLQQSNRDFLAGLAVAYSGIAIVVLGLVGWAVMFIAARNKNRR